MIPMLAHLAQWLGRRVVAATTQVRLLASQVSLGKSNSAAMRPAPGSAGANLNCQVKHRAGLRASIISHRITGT